MLLDNTCWSNITPVNEAYFGETPHLINAQRLLGQFRSKYIGPKYVFDIKCLNDPLIKKFNHEMEEEFGFEVFDLQIDASEIINTYTIPVGMKYDANPKKNPVLKTKNGYKFKKEAGYCCLVYIHAGVLFDNKFTDRECMALILHEVGHNFAGAVNGSIGMFEALHRGINLVTLLVTTVFNPATPLLHYIIFTNNGNKWMINFRERMKKEYPQIMQFCAMIEVFFTHVSNAMSEINFVKSVFTMGALPFEYLNRIMGYIYSKLIGAIVNPGIILFTIYGYPHEKFSDGFATMYGYGPDLSSTFTKVNPSNHGLVTQQWLNDNAPIIATVRNTLMLPLMMVLHSLDEHPIDMERATSNVRILREELKYCDPRMKKRIESDIKRIEDDIDKYYTYRKKYNDTNLPNRLYWTLLFNLVGGDFRHHWMDWLFNTKEALTTKADKK